MCIHVHTFAMQTDAKHANYNYKYNCSCSNNCNCRNNFHSKR